MPQAIAVLLVDYHMLLRGGVSLLLGSYPDLQVIGQAGTAEEASALTEYAPPDVVVFDVDLPGNHGGTELIRLIRRKNPHVRFVVLTNSLEPVAIHEALRAGALGYLLKTVSIDELAQAIRAAHHGMPVLSPEVTQVLIEQAYPSGEHLRSLTAREQEVLDLIARGLNNHEIAAALHISLSTVQFHVGNILDKLDVQNRTQAATFALRHHLASGNA